MIASVIEASTRSVSTSVAAVWPTPSGAAAVQPLGHAEALGDVAARRARDGLGADLRQAPGAEALGLQPRVQPVGHRQAEDAVAQEGQPRVGVRAPLGPGGVGEDLAVQVLGQLVEEVAQELATRSGSAAGAWARTKSTAWPTVRISRRLLVGHAHAVGVLELLDERVEVERVGLEVLLEARGLVDARRVDVELVGQVVWTSVKTSSRVMAAAR